MTDRATTLIMPVDQLQRRFGVEGDLESAWPILVRTAKRLGWTIETDLEAVKAGERVTLTRQPPGERHANPAHRQP